MNINKGDLVRVSRSARGNEGMIGVALEYAAAYRYASKEIFNSWLVQFEREAPNPPMQATDAPTLAYYVPAANLVRIAGPGTQVDVETDASLDHEVPA